MNSTLHARIDRLDLAVRSLARLVFGDVEGHPFHGNQWTDGSGETLDPSVAFTEGASLARWARVTGGPATSRADSMKLRFVDDGRLTADQQNAIGAYTTAAYGAINGGLRGSERTESKWLDAKIKNLDAATYKFQLNEDAVVVRGFSATTEQLNDLLPGSIFHDPGYASTSLDAKTAIDFARDNAVNGKDAVVLAMSLPAGTSGFPGAADEREWVLPRGSRFEVQSHETATDGMHYVVAKYIPPESHR